MENSYEYAERIFEDERVKSEYQERLEERGWIWRGNHQFELFFDRLHDLRLVSGRDILFRETAIKEKMGNWREYYGAIFPGTKVRFFRAHDYNGNEIKGNMMRGVYTKAQRFLC